MTIKNTFEKRSYVISVSDEGKVMSEKLPEQPTGWQTLARLFLKDIRYHIHSIYIKLWWRYMPGYKIKVKWPNDDGITDPNYHYRPWMEHHVGTQGWDWQWFIEDNDMHNNQLTLKFRMGREQQAVLAALMWS